MSTTHAPPVHAHRLHVNPWLVAVIALAAALIALGSWVIVDHYTGGDSATQDATTLIDKFDAAGNAGDAKALAALLTNDVVMRSEGNILTGAQDLQDAAAASAGSLRVERIAPVTVEGDFASTFIRATEAGSDRTLIAVYQFEDGKISRLWGFELGATSPFDNAVMP